MRALTGNLTLGLWALAATLLIAAGIGRGDSVEQLHRTSAPYEQDILRWEIVHFPDKWFNLAVGVFGRPDAEERLERVQEFFRVSGELNEKRREIERVLAEGAPDAEVAA
ncbi:MAG: hypothetical protein F4X54_08075, partial [Chloroflexi bacterium]|nr:hypothetical protein [Chloroflexota bacterium]